MKTIWTLQAATLLLLPSICNAATVEYRHPNLTIVAAHEPLASVLQSLGKEMQIYVTIPTGLNPVVNCDIQKQPVRRAFSTLLGDVGYSLEWNEKTGRLVGLTMLTDSNMTAEYAASDRPPGIQSGKQAAPVPVANSSWREEGSPVDQATTAIYSQLEAAREEEEARLSEQQEAQEEQLTEEVAQHEGEMTTYLQSLGLVLDHPPPAR